MTRLFTIIFTLIILLGSSVMIVLLGIGEFSGGDGFLRSCRYNQETKTNDDCFWFWDRLENNQEILQ